MTLCESTPREPPDSDALNRVFRNGVGSGMLDEALLPPLACLTSRRIGLLAFLQGSDIRKKHGVWVAQSSGIAQVNDGWIRIPIKTGESMTFFVLHNFFEDIGLIEWARARTGFLFEALHDGHDNPAKYASKTMENLLDRSEATGAFHGFRGGGIEHMRKNKKVDGRARRLQSGHRLMDEHDKYGFRSLSAEDCQTLANLPLHKGVDWSIFRNLDFEMMSKARRSAGRKKERGVTWPRHRRLPLPTLHLASTPVVAALTRLSAPSTSPIVLAHNRGRLTTLKRLSPASAKAAAASRQPPSTSPRLRCKRGSRLA